MALDQSQVDVADHDRYLLYEMLCRKVSFRAPVRGRRRGRKRTGVVEQVCRNIFENAVELTLSGQLFQFDEPEKIVRYGGSIVFVYGDINVTEMTDDELFTEMRLSADNGETLQEILSRTRPRVIRMVTFMLGEPVKRSRRTWRKSN